MTTATIEPGVIGTLPDPRIAVYHGSDPAAFVAQCCVRPRDDERLLRWVEECRSIVDGTYRPVHWVPVELRHIKDWCTDLGWNHPTFSECCQLLRSIFAPPWLCGAAECPECEGDLWVDTDEPKGGRRCTKCTDGSILTPPEFDERWRTSNVIDLAKVIRGYAVHKHLALHQPRFARMPILADALMDAGCDNKAMIWHARENGAYVAGDWVLSLILGA